MATATFAGNLTKDPEVHMGQNGQPIVKLTVASTERIFDREKNAWRDGNPTFVEASFFRQEAQNILDTPAFAKGQRVVLTGEPNVRVYDRRDGSKGSQLEIKKAEIGLSPKFRAVGGGAPQQGYNQSQGQPQQGYGQPQGYDQAAAEQDPFATPAPSQDAFGSWDAAPDNSGGIPGF